MIICKECGHHNAREDAFCGSCGAFLEWAGEPVVEPVEVVPVAESPAAPPARAGLVERVKVTLGMESGDQADAGAPGAEPASAAATGAAAEGDQVVAPTAAGPPAAPSPAVAPPPSVPPPPSGPPRAAALPTAPPAPLGAPDDPAAPGRPVDPERAGDGGTVVEPQRNSADEETARAAALVSKPRAEERRATPTAAASPNVTAGGDATSRPSPAGGMKPAEERHRPVTPTLSAPSRTIRPGDLVCGQCGEGNDASRRFCRRCGTTLADSVVAKSPWWRRFVPRRSKATPTAGTRRGRGGARGKGLRVGVSRAKSLRTHAFKAMLVLSMLGVGASFAGPFKEPIRDALGTGRDKIRKVVGEPEPVRPTGAVAASQLPGREAGRLVDQIRNTSWAEATPGFGEGTVIDITFGAPVNVSKLGITSGASETPEAFVAQPRPRDVIVVFSDASSRTLRLEDTPDFQSFDVSAKGVTSARFEIRTVYGGTGGDATAIAELEFFGRN